MRQGDWGEWEMRTDASVCVWVTGFVYFSDVRHCHFLFDWGTIVWNPELLAGWMLDEWKELYK